MPERFLEENRFLFLDTGLGPNELLLQSFTGTEAVSQMFSFQLELLSENPRIRFEKILGQEISFGVAGEEGQEKRHIHGVVTSFSQLPSTHRFSKYRAEVSPKLWTLTRKVNSRIFQNMKAPDILRKVLGGLDTSFELMKSYSTREFCVQYRESDFNFVSRLMEEEGIFYFFKHSANGHKMVLSDNPQSHPDLPGESDLIYDELTGGVREESRIFDWEKTQHWSSGKYSLRENYFEMPSTRLDANMPVRDGAPVGKVSHKLKVGGNEQFEIYDYPGGHAKLGSTSEKMRAGDALARVGMEQLEVSQFTIRGQSNIWAVVPGYRFMLQRHINADGQYVLTSVVHSGREGSFHSDNEEDSRPHYSNIFTCIPFALPFRPARVSTKPHVWGCQTAYVTGPAGAEIYTDKHGRVKVQFHWDREGKSDADSSCWIRVASIWAGKNWGAIHLPRVGQEVIVDFLEGDPDRPIIVGSVYNSDQQPPYSLPDNKTKSGMRSRSSKGGSGGNYNEILLEDKMGQEQITIHAEKDLLTEVENNETRTVGHDRKTTIQNDDTSNINNKRSATVGSDDSENIGGSQTITIASSKSETVGSSMTLTITSSETVSVGSSKSETIGASRSATIGASDSLTAGGSVSITSGGSISITSGATVTISAPMVVLTTAMLSVAGVVQCTSVVSPTYTPGVGNMM